MTTATTNPLSMIPDRARVALYLLYAFASIVLTAIMAGYAAIQAVAPVWVVFGLALLGSLGTGFGFTAAANVKVAAKPEALDVLPEDEAGEDPTVEDPDDTGEFTEAGE